MPVECDNHDDCIEVDLEWLKNELRGLTKRQRVLILEEYQRGVREYSGINMKEFGAFMGAFTEFEVEDDRS
jgi:hypothetical protein